MKHHRPPDLAASALELGVVLDREQLERLLVFERLLVDRAVPLGYVARSDAPRIRVRHVLDSLRAAPFAGAGSAYDLGSGAGLPGVVVAVARPQARVHLVERRGGKVAFLELVVDTLAISNVTVHHARVETLTEPVDVCFARALAPLDRAWELARPLLRPGGRLVYFAGSAAGARVAAGGGGIRVLPPPPVLATAGPLAIMTAQ